MQLCNLPSIPTTFDNIVVILIPQCCSSQFWAGEFGQRTEEQTMYDKSYNVDQAQNYKKHERFLQAKKQHDVEDKSLSSESRVQRVGVLAMILMLQYDGQQEGTKSILQQVSRLETPRRKDCCCPTITRWVGRFQEERSISIE